MSKRINVSSNFFLPPGSHTILVFPYRREPTYAILSLYLALVSAVSAATSHVLSTESPAEHGQRTAGCDTSLVVSGGVDCERRRRNVYDKKPQRYAKDNRTAHLTARSDKSVAYVTLLDVLYC